MTGIFLYYCKNGQFNPIELEKNADLLSHRGKMNESRFIRLNLYLKTFVNKAQKDNANVAVTITDGALELGYSVIDGKILNEPEFRASLPPNIQSNTDINTAVFFGYSHLGNDLFTKIQGMYSILIVNEHGIVIAKDPVGFNPLYVVNTDDFVIITSELKALQGFEGTPKILDPGFIYRYDFKSQTAEYSAFFPTINFTKGQPVNKEDVDSIKTRLFTMLDRIIAKNIDVCCPVASLLSGGIDSAIICAIAQKYIPDLRVYTVAAEGSLDLKYATDFVKKYPKLKHTVFKITLEDLISVVKDVIYHLETFDAALIRSALPMYYLCSKIEKDVGVLLTGEGGDELFGGYEYLKDLTREELRREFLEMMEIEHATGLQRVDRIPYAFGIEARAPWFDFSLARYAFQVPMELKIRKSDDRFVEKWIMRETFKSVLPESIYKRKKAKFSQGVGTELLLRDYCVNLITDEEFEAEKQIYPNIDVKNKEELYYWRIFKDLFDPSEEFIESLPRTKVFTL